MESFTKIGLGVALFAAVLAFGGTLPLVLIAVELLLLLLGVLVAVGYAWLPSPAPRLPWVAPVALLALVALQLIPLPTSLLSLLGTSDVASIGSTNALSIAPYQTWSYAVVLSSYIVAFYLAAILSSERKGRRQLVFVLLALGAFEAFYGLLQYLTGWQKIFTYTKVYNVEEATGTYINRNHFAGLLEMILPFALALAWYQFSRFWGPRPEPAWNEGTGAGESHFPKSVFWFFLAVFLFAALAFSRSRMGITAAVISILVMIVLIATHGAQPHRKIGLVLAVAFLAVGAVMAVWIGAEPVVERFEDLSGELERTEVGRKAMWQDTLELIGQRPWLGSGLGTFPLAYTAVQTVHLTFAVDHAHNDYLQIVSEIGLVGGLLLFASIFYVLIATIRRLGSATGTFDRAVAVGCVGSLVAILLHSLTDFNLYIPANALVFSVILGLAYTVSSGGEASGREDHTIDRD